MEQAGATIIQRTSTDGAMGAGGITRIVEHIRITRDIKRWLARHPEVTVHVPVDSPAANFPICRITKPAGCRVVHLVAPQLWAWAPWRIRKLRRLTDLVLCLLPFEEPYFLNRGVPAKFIGHPVISRCLNSLNTDTEPAETLPPLPDAGDGPQIALLPGSRSGEIKRHARDMAVIAERIALSHANANAAAVFVAANKQAAALIDSETRDLRQRGSVCWSISTGQLSRVLRWADLALVCSGTATLDVASHAIPMVVMYKLNPLSWNLVGRWLLTTRHIALPNVIANRRIVPEFIPYHRSLARITEQACQLLDNHDLAERQLADVAEIMKLFRDRNPGQLATELILAQHARTIHSRQLNPTDRHPHPCPHPG